GQPSNNNMVVTLVPQAGLSPSAGQTGVTSSLRGSGLRPPTLAVVNGSAVGVSLTVGGSPRPVDNAAWNDSTLPFDPRNSGGPVVLSFNVVNDLSRPASDQGNLSNVVVNAGSYNFEPPAASQGIIAHQVVGSRFHVGGQYLGQSGGLGFPDGSFVRGSGWTSGGFDAYVPAGAQPGQARVLVDGFGSVPGPTVSIDPRLDSVSVPAASAGQTVRVAGFNFGAGPGHARVAGADQPVTGWADQAVVFTVSPDSDGGPVSITRSDGALVQGPALAVVPRLDRTEANNLPAGSQVVVDGVSLGSATGTAALAAADITPLLWSRTSVLLQLPPTLSPGTFPLTLVSATGARSNPLNLTIVAAPNQAPGSRGRPGSVLVPGGVVAPSFDNNHDFVKPIRPPSPVYFNITTDPHKVRAGGRAAVTVVLKLNDKPVPGAEVKLSMLFTPGSDFAFMPESGVTDASGTFKARVTVSKVPGDSIIAATSGVFSDQDHVAGTGADGKIVRSPTLTNPAAQNPGFAPLALIGLLAVGLVGAGFYLNVRSIGA
ncbi:MAG: hypothetical protein ABR573_07075, partial [Candidatus Dormibacteria bacterium]